MRKMVLDGSDLAGKVAGYLKKDPRLVRQAAEDIYATMVDDIILEICFDLHRSVKAGLFEVTDTENNRQTISIAGHVDVFGHQVQTITGLPCLKTIPLIECPNCKRQLAASRFAPHLEKCMGMGRNSSRLASRRLATSNKESYRDVEEEEEVDGDEDWIEPGKVNNNRRKRDKNSPKRTKTGLRSKGESADGLITPPHSYDQLSTDDRRQLLNTICGVVSGYNGKICTRSIKCPAHNDTQRRDVRLKWLGGGSDEAIDIDTLSEGDTAALRESLAMLSNASSPAESTISTSSNPSRAARREKTRRGKKTRPGSKTGSSRGSTPPMME